MKKILLIILTLLLLFTHISSGFALATPPPPSGLVKTNTPDFSLRNGLTWGMSEAACLQKLKEESLDIYTTEDMGISIESLYPNDKGKNEIWMYVSLVTLGKDDENVALGLMGTKKTGLFEVMYWVYPVGDVNARLSELQTSIEKKYGKLEVKKNYGNYKYVAWEYFDYASISLYIEKTDTSTIYIQYGSPDREDIMKSINDGSYYITTPYGL